MNTLTYALVVVLLSVSTLAGAADWSLQDINEAYGGGDPSESSVSAAPGNPADASAGARSTEDYSWGTEDMNEAYGGDPS